MPQYKITAVNPEVKKWSSKYGEMVTYEIKLEGHGYPVQLNQKPETPAPTVGQDLEGEIENANYPDGALYYKFRKASKGFGGAVSGSNPEWVKLIEQLNRVEQKIDQLLAGSPSGRVADPTPANSLATNEGKSHPASPEEPIPW